MNEIEETNDWDEIDVEAEKEDENEKNSSKKVRQKMKTDEWNEKMGVNGENENEFHEELYDS